MELMESMLLKMNEPFALGCYGIHRYNNKLCVPDVDDLRTRVVAEAHVSRYSIHPGSTKMYQDLKQIYLWDGMKNGIAEYVAKCLNCQQVKAEHLNPSDLTLIIYVPNWKWEAINMHFVVGLLRTRRKNDSIWVIVNRLTKSAHFVPLKSTYRDEDSVRLYIYEIMGVMEFLCISF